MHPFHNIGHDGSLRSALTAAGDEVCNGNALSPETTPEPLPASVGQQRVNKLRTQNIDGTRDSNIILMHPGCEF